MAPLQVTSRFSQYLPEWLTPTNEWIHNSLEEICQTPGFRSVWKSGSNPGLLLVEVLAKWLALAELCCLGTCCYISDWLKYTKNLDNSFSLCLPHTLLNIMPCNCFSAVGISQAWESSTWLLITMHSSLLHLIVTSAEVCDQCGLSVILCAVGLLLQK